MQDANAKRDVPVDGTDSPAMSSVRIPLPGHTVARRRSSLAGSRSRTKRTNHGKALRANGARFRTGTTALILVTSGMFVPVEEALTEVRRRTNVVVNRTEKRIPAIAAARGVFNHFRMGGEAWSGLGAKGNTSESHSTLSNAQSELS